MPIRRELKPLYPPDWDQISHYIRFVRAAGRCECCGRPHGRTVLCLPNGRWFDEQRQEWRDGRGRPVPAPSLLEYAEYRRTVVRLAAAHWRDHHPANCAPGNLKAVCQRCHLLHDRPHHLEQRRITYKLRRALGDLFEGPYQTMVARGRKRRQATRSGDVRTDRLARR